MASEPTLLISPDTRYYDLPQALPLDCGAALRHVRVAYRTWGRLNDAHDNAVVVCHALTGSADADGWWGRLFGAERAFDPAVDFVVCANLLGSCYGTTGPAAIDPATGQTRGADFPPVTVRDMVRTQRELLRHLGVAGVQLAIGGSLGGMLALEWALLYPDLVRAIAPVAVSGRHSAWCIAFSEAQRQAIYADRNWRSGRYDAAAPPTEGLAAARMMGMCTYRSRGSFESRFARSRQGRGELFQVESYLRHQGRKLIERFDANAYVTLTKAMDAHDVGAGRAGYEEALRSIAQPALIVAIPSDVLYPPEEQEELAAFMPRAELRQLDSPHGHDAFLIDMEPLNELIVTFRRRVAAGR
jgi:homoserine O-acetyltransferase